MFLVYNIKVQQPTNWISTCIHYMQLYAISNWYQNLKRMYHAVVKNHLFLLLIVYNVYIWILHRSILSYMKYFFTIYSIKNESLWMRIGNKSTAICFIFKIEYPREWQTYSSPSLYSVTFILVSLPIIAPLPINQQVTCISQQIIINRVHKNTLVLTGTLLFPTLYSQ